MVGAGEFPTIPWFSEGFAEASGGFGSWHAGCNREGAVLKTDEDEVKRTERGCGSAAAGPGGAAPGALVAEEEGDEEPRSKHFTSTRNACKLCTPLGACLAFRGVEGCIPFLHGSQGCSTYIRRYLISHGSRTGPSAGVTTALSPMAMPATGALIGMPASIMEREPPQTVAIEEEPLLSVMSETILMV